jgi:excinuclease ABC subunit C
VSDVFDSKAFLKTVTSQPGVYRMYDAGGTVIYVGKAKDLKKRLSSYFRSNLASRKTEALVALINSIDVTVTHTETEALLLEHNYIKLYQPRYNVLLRDDKSYPFIFLSGDTHPRLACTVAQNMRRVNILARSLTGMPCVKPWRCCKKSSRFVNARTAFIATAHVPACNTRLGAAWALRCRPGDEEEYAQQVEYVRLFLAGKDDQVLTQLIARMEKASSALEFEEAARIRDQIQAVRRVTEKQFVSNTGDDLDVIGVAFDAGWPASTCCLFARAKCSAAAAISRKCLAVPSWVRLLKPLWASSICRAARCARCLLRSCSISILMIKPCWPIRFLSWRGGASMSRPNRAAIARVISSWREPMPPRH